MSILASCAVVSPLASVPKLITLSLNPVTTRLPAPQVEPELSANASCVTPASRFRFRLPAPVLIRPAPD